jgi:hypothetical protein
MATGSSLCTNNTMKSIRQEESINQVGGQIKLEENESNKPLRIEEKLNKVSY